MKVTILLPASLIIKVNIITDKIKVICNTINYRQGYIEVIPNIHEQCINIETWQIDPRVNISDTELTSEKILDKDVNGNTEIELSLEDAEHLLSLLSDAISKVKT